MECLAIANHLFSIHT